MVTGGRGYDKSSDVDMCKGCAMTMIKLLVDVTNRGRTKNKDCIEGRRRDDKRLKGCIDYKAKRGRDGWWGGSASKITPRVG